MATFAFTDAHITINSVDLSAWGVELTVEIGVEMLDGTTFGATARVNNPGLKTGSAQVVFLQDYAAGAPDATLFPLVGAAAFTMLWRPTSAVVGATNPQYSTLMVVSAYGPVGEGVGDQAKCNVSLENASTTGWARATS